MQALLDLMFSKPDESVLVGVTRVVVYGAGCTGRLVARCLSSHGVEVKAFLDCGATPGQMADGVPVFYPEESDGLTDVPVIVAVFNPHPSARFSDIAATLAKLGFASVCSLEQYYLSHPNFFPDIYWLTAPAFYRTKIDELEAADALWTDARSRELYRALISYRVSGCQDYLPEPDPLESQYLPDDVPLWTRMHNFVDIGAFDGDTLEAFRIKGIALKKVIAFEPDMKNFNKLCERVKNHGPYAEETTLVPAGVGENCVRVGFSVDASAGSKVIENGQIAFQIPVVNLDAVLHGFAPSYIKMDIEGAEESALNGMKDLIIRDRPVLAISVYHRPQDLYWLALLIKRWVVRADFYLRMYGEHTLDTVLYVLPE